MDQIQDKRILLMESALELIRENGFHGTPVSSVAKHAGVAAGTVYTYFRSKDELIIALYHYVKAGLLKEISARDQVSDPFEHRFFALWNNLIEVYLAKPAYQNFLEQFVSSPFNSREIQQGPDPWGEWLNAFFKEGIESGDLKPLSPTILAVMVMGSVISLIRYKVYYKSKKSIAGEDLQLIPSMVWDGIKNK
jgi:AcrR family transcriptional regulator